MNNDTYYALRHEATLVIQQQLCSILKEIVSDRCVSHSNAGLIEPIGRLWEILGLEWVKENEDG